MHYKNPVKGSYKPTNIGGYEQQQPSRIPSKRMYSPKYTVPGPDQVSPRNQSSQFQSGSPRHWKSYLAPQLQRLAPRQNDIQYERPPAQQPSPISPKGYSSAYNLRQNEAINARQQERTNGLYDRNSNTQQVRKEQYSRRKEEIMNRIKLLQERAAIEQDRGVSPGLSSGQQSPAQLSQLRILNPGNSEELMNRIIYLEQRIENMNIQFDNKLKKEISDLQKRLRAEVRQK